MSNNRVKAVPQTYKGVVFASTLEADWAATFDEYGFLWSYEPAALRLSDGQTYRCDFWLPEQRIWCEVKGPCDDRISKPQRLYRDLYCDQDDWTAPMVVILREPHCGETVIERGDGSPVGFGDCKKCDRKTFVDLYGAWQCRMCGTWDKRLSSEFRSTIYGAWVTPVNFQRVSREHFVQLTPSGRRK